MSNIELHQEAHRRMNEQGAEAAAEMFTDDIVYLDAARGLTLKGKEESTGWLREWKTAFSDARVEAAEYLDAGDWTICRFQGRGVNDGAFGPFPATGKQLDAPFCELVRWHGGKAAEGAMYYDTATIMVQLGHMPAPTA